MLSDHIAAATRVATGVSGLELLVLFGSRARGDARADSDWDFGYIGSAALNADDLLAALVTAIHSDRIDLVDLTRAGGLLRFRVARDGRPIVGGSSGAFARFWMNAVSFWCDVEPVLRPGYERVLQRVSP